MEAAYVGSGAVLAGLLVLGRGQKGGEHQHHNHIEFPWILSFCSIQQERRRQFCVWQASPPYVQEALLNVIPHVNFLFFFHLSHVTHNKHPSSLSRSELLTLFPYISKLMG